MNEAPEGRAGPAVELLGGDGSLRRSMRSCEEAHFRLVSAPDCAGLTWNRRRGESQQRKPRLRCSAAMTSWRQPRAAAWPGRHTAGFCPSVWRLTSLARKAHRGVAIPTETRRSDRDETIRYETIRVERSYTIRDGKLDFCFFARCRNRLYRQVPPCPSSPTFRDGYSATDWRALHPTSTRHAR